MRPKTNERSNTSPLAAPLGLDLPTGLHSTGVAPDEDDPAVGEWLFKKNEVVLGPVNASVILSRIQADEIDGETPIGREAGKWRPLKDIEYFAQEVERATRRKEMEAQRRFAEAKRRKEQGIRTAMYATAVGFPLVTGFMVGEVLATKRPWDDRAEWVAALPSLMELPPPPSVVLPPVSSANQRAKASKPDEADSPATEVEERPAKSASLKAKSVAKDEPKKSKRKRRAKTASAGNRDPESQPAETEKTPKKQKSSDTVPETLTNQQVMAGLAKGKSGIGECLQKENARNADMPSVVTLMFTVTEEGQAAMVKVKERQVRNGPLADCLREVVSKLRWPKFSGERKNAEVPFRIRK